MARPPLGAGPPRPPLRRRLLRLYEALDRRFGPHGCPGCSSGRSAFEIVVGAILAQSTARVNVGRALVRLRRAGALHPARLAALAPGRLAGLVRPAGSPRAKAGRLRALVRHLVRRHGGSLRRFLRQPAAALRAELLAIPGISPGTADAILLHAAGRPVFVVDAGTRRILARHRLAPPDADDAGLKALFEASLPRDPALFTQYHALLARVAKEYCRARPRCEACPLRFDLRGRPPRLVPGRSQTRPRAARRPGGSVNIAR